MKKNSIFKAILNHDFFIVDNRLVLSEEYLKKTKPKKLTGSRFGSLFENQTAQVKTWMQMFNIYAEPFDEMYSVAGQTIEPKLRDYYSELTNVKYQVYDPKKVNWDVFNNNEIFGGIPDGEPLDTNNQINYKTGNRLIEIKTASIDAFLFKKDHGFYYLQKQDNYPIVKNKDAKLNSWIVDDHVIIPDSYLFQISLYMYLRNINNGVFVIGFVPTADYVHPEQYDVKKNLVKIVNYDLQTNAFASYLKYATNWWDTYIKTGISPKLSDADLMWLKEAYDL